MCAQTQTLQVHTADSMASPACLSTARACSQMIVRPDTKLTAATLFTKLDGYLKANRVRFSDLFAAADADRNGCLDASELVRLVEEVIGATTPLGASDGAYLMAMLDLDASRSITAEEFLAAAKQFLELASRQGGVQEREVKDTYAAACAALKGPGKVRHLIYSGQAMPCHAVRMRASLWCDIRS